MAFANIMLRIGKTKKIEEQFNEGFLWFGCPANWIDLAKMDKTGKADKYEAERVEKFRKLLEQTEQYRRKNQYE